MSWIIVAGLASLLTAVQLIPQTIRAIRAKNLKSISLTTFSLTSLTAFLWILYGAHIHDVAIIFANTITFVCAITIVLLKIKRK